MKKFISLIFTYLVLSGCISIPGAISKYEAVENKISLGDSKDKVLSILEPTQKDLLSRWKKKPEKFLNDGTLVEIYFFRSGWQTDGITTDDEFTPYVFVDNNLTAIGWSALGGSKTQGQATPQYIPNSGYSPLNNNRINQQILNHGAGGCTPNFATGGCL